jgi:hypothetical protein
VSSGRSTAVAVLGVVAVAAVASYGLADMIDIALTSELSLAAGGGSMSSVDRVIERSTAPALLGVATAQTMNLPIVSGMRTTSRASQFIWFRSLYAASGLLVLVDPGSNQLCTFFWRSAVNLDAVLA